jgi:hypothetical protein
MFEFADQLAPGLLMKIVTIRPPSCRGACPWVGGWCRFPKERKLILQTDHPPQSETPQRYFRQDFTPKRSIIFAMAGGQYSDTR